MSILFDCKLVSEPQKSTRNCGSYITTEKHVYTHPHNSKSSAKHLLLNESTGKNIHITRNIPHGPHSIPTAGSGQGAVMVFNIFQFLEENLHFKEPGL